MCYKYKTEQTMWAKYNCLEQMGVCIFMLGQAISTPRGQMGVLRTNARAFVKLWVFYKFIKQAGRGETQTRILNKVVI